MKPYLKFIFFLTLTPLLSFAQQKDIQQTIASLEKFAANNPIEKVHLHLDKDEYSAGETIWFKAYTVLNSNNFPSGFSKIAYVELLDPNDKILLSNRIPLTSGLGIGDFLLKDTILEGTYRIRAYTQWMKNYPSDYYYDRSIQISNGRGDNVRTITNFAIQENNNQQCEVSLQTLAGVKIINTEVQYEILAKGKATKGRTKTDANGLLRIHLAKEISGGQILLKFRSIDERPISKVIQIKTPKAGNSLAILPEGGQLLAGMENSLAFKAIRADAKGIPTKIDIINAKQDTVASLQTNALGMGKTSVYIENGEKYTAIAHFEDHSTLKKDLPAAQQSGYNIIVNNLNQKTLFAQVNLSSDLIQSQQIYLVLQHQGKISFVAKQIATSNSLLFSVEKEHLPSGILEISILNEAQLPIIERPIFILHKRDLLPLQIKLSKNKYSKREEVKVAIISGEEQDSLRYASLSASVVNLNKTKVDRTAPCIFSDLLLQADLKGYIEKPGEYFSDLNNINFLDIDLLLLTQGWRKLEWELAEKIKIYPVEKGITISGKVKKLGGRASLSGAKVSLRATHDFINAIDTLTDTKGLFTFSNLVFSDSTKFIIDAKDDKGKTNVDLQVDTLPQVAHFANPNYPELQNDINSLQRNEINHLQQYLNELHKKGLSQQTIYLSEVSVQGREKSKASENSQNLNGSGRADFTLGADDLSSCPTLEMCLSGRLPGIYFRDGMPINTRGNGAMAVFLDGMQIDSDQFQSIFPENIASIEVLRNVNYTAIYGSRGANGILVITSKTGLDARRAPTVRSHMKGLNPQGYYLNRAFYAPDYNRDTGIKLDRDLRTTISWEPNIIIDQSGQYNYSFFTADEAGTYQVTLEGIDFSGRLGRKIYTFEIE